MVNPRLATLCIRCLVHFYLQTHYRYKIDQTSRTMIRKYIPELKAKCNMTFLKFSFTFFPCFNYKVKLTHMVLVLDGSSGLVAHP